MSPDPKVELSESEADVRGFLEWGGGLARPSSLRTIMTEYDRMREALAASDEWEAEHRAILDRLRALADTYHPREMDDERVIDWDLLEALITEIRR